MGALAVPWALAGLLVAATPGDAPYWRLLLRAGVAGGALWCGWLAWRGGSAALLPLPRPPPRPLTRATVAAATGSTASLALAAAADGRGGGAMRRSASARSVATAAPPPPPPLPTSPSKDETPRPAPASPGLAALRTVFCTALAISCIALAAWAGGEGGGGAAFNLPSAGWATAAVAAALLLTHAACSSLPRCFTLGEASAVALVVSLAACDGAARAFAFSAPAGSLAAHWSATALPPPLLSVRSPTTTARSPESAFVQGVLLTALAGGAAAAPLATAALDRRDWAAAVALVAAAAGCAPAALAAGGWALRYAAATPARAAFAASWAAGLAVGLPAMHAAATAASLPRTILRKGYHGLAVAIFAPAVLGGQAGLVAAGSAAAGAALAALEVARIAGARSTRAGASLDAFMSKFLDAQDAGPVLVSHFALLAGVAGPVWVVVSAAAPAPTSSPPPSLLLALTGVVSLGVTDTAASVIGRACGRRRLWGGAKTVEGAVAGAVAGGVAWAALLLLGGGGRAASLPLLLPLALASALTAALEAATTQLDNVFLPLHHLGLVGALVGGVL